MRFLKAAAVIAASLILFSALPISAQEKADTKNDKAKYYTVNGYRHGISYFKMTHYQQIVPKAEGHLDFKHYHTYTEIVSLLKKWEKEYPDLIDLYVSGKSFEGRDIYQVTLTNKKTGKDTDKPAMAIDANRHSGEVTAAESALWMLNHMIKKYGTDDEITRLVDRNAFYFRIKNNPDGSMLYLNTVQSNRSSVHPHDSDRDGLIDEDPYEDLDGDNFIYSIRVKVEQDSGDYVIDPRDETKRMMKRVKKGTGNYRIYSEGIDNDNDGKYNEDGIGGLDLHRNYPENWRPEPGKDATGRGWTQFGAGEFPMSEPEVRSFVLFLLEHPNVSVVNSMDTRVPMHLRPPSTSKQEERMYPEDMAFYEYFDKKGMEITGYPWAGDVYYKYRTRRKTDRVTGEPTKPYPLFGHGPDFGYWYYGSIWYGDELWNGGIMDDYNKDGEKDELDALYWDDNFNGGRGFKEWTEFQHPQLGKVEIGGFNVKFFSQNPPPEFLEEWAKKEALFNIMLANNLPRIELKDVSVKPADKKNEYTVEVIFTNAGYLPTALQQAKLVKIVKKDRVNLEYDKELPEAKKKCIEILSPETINKDIEFERTVQGQIQKAVFRVKLDGIDGVTAKVNILSTRGGKVTKEIVIGNKVK